MPAKTAKEVISTVREATVAVLKQPEVARRMRDIAFTPVGDRPEEFAAFITAEVRKWGKIIRATGLSVD